MTDSSRQKLRKKLKQFRIEKKNENMTYQTHGTQ